MQSILVSCVAHRGIRYRFHSHGADIIAESSKRTLAVRWFEVRRVAYKNRPNALREIKVELTGDHRDKAIAALVLAGYAECDDRDPIVLATIRAFATKRGIAFRVLEASARSERGVK